jgi:methanogenic corrinoid protein MtbC1
MHILGLSIVSELFRSDGWHVVMEMASSEKDLIQTLRREWFDMVGLSVALVEQIPGLPSLVSTIRAEALNPNTQVILGGRAVLLDEDLLTKTGADGMSAHAPEAIMIANQLLSTKK